MVLEFDTPFASIESAHEFMGLLAEAAADARQTTENDLAATSDEVSRRRDALRVVLYKVQKLEQHLASSRRLLNDLRTLRRLLFEERTESTNAAEVRHKPAI